MACQPGLGGLLGATGTSACRRACCSVALAVLLIAGGKCSPRRASATPAPSRLRSARRRARAERVNCIVVGSSWSVAEQLQLQPDRRGRLHRPYRVDRTTASRCHWAANISRPTMILSGPRALRCHSSVNYWMNGRTSSVEKSQPQPAGCRVVRNRHRRCCFSPPAWSGHCRRLSAGPKKRRHRSS
jgi:hypothetical protein